MVMGTPVAVAADIDMSVAALNLRRKFNES
jgi:hypothetical protein